MKALTLKVLPLETLPLDTLSKVSPAKNSFSKNATISIKSVIIIFTITLTLAFLLSASAVFAKTGEIVKFSAAPSDSVTTSVLTQIVSLNKATVKQLSSLKGIGKKKAQAIIAYRNTYGDFKSVNDLAHVKGIGTQIIFANKGRLKI